MGGIPLEYAKTAKPWRRLRRVLLVVVLVLAGLLAVRWAPALRRNAELWWWQRQCLNYVAPPRVVFDRGREDFAVAEADAAVPSAWREFYRVYSPPGFVSHGTAYLGERRDAQGRGRLVAVDLMISLGDSAPVVVGRSFEPGNPLRPAREIFARAEILPDFQPMRVWTGQGDSADSSHFTIAFLDTAGAARVLHGYLTDDGGIRFHVTD